MRNGVSVRRDGTACRPSRCLFCHFCSLRSDGCPTALFFCRSVENLCSCRYAGGYGPVVFRSPVFGVRGVCEGKNRKRESVASETRVRSRPFQGLSASLTRRRNGCPSGQQAVLPRGRRGSFPRAFVPCGFRPSNFCAGVPEPGPEAAMRRNSRIPENSSSLNSGAVRGPGLSVRPLRLRHSARLRGACRCVFVFPTKKAAREKSDGFSVKRNSGPLPIACDRITRS